MVNRSGEVVAMMFAADEGGGIAGGFGVPLEAIRHALTDDPRSRPTPAPAWA